MAVYHISDQVLVTLKGSLFSQTILTTFGYKVTDITGAPNYQTVSEQLFDLLNIPTGFIDKYLAITPPEYSMNEVWVQVVRATRLAKVGFAMAVDGTNAASTTVTNTACTITKRGPEANKRNLGSVHIPISPDSDGIASGEIGGALKTKMGLFAAQMVMPRTTAAGPVTFTPCIINALGSFPPVIYETTLVQDTVRVSRRRTVRLGI